MLRLTVDVRRAVNLAAHLTPEEMQPLLLKAMQKALAPVARAVRARAPIGVNRPSRGHLAGRLQRSIGVSVRRAKRVRYGIWAGIRGEFYGRLVETGHKGARPHPFVQPVVDANLEQIQRTLEDEVAKGLEFRARLARAVR